TYFLNDPVNGDQFEQAEKRLVLGGAASQTWLTKVAGREVTNTLGLQLRRDRLDPVGLYASAARARPAPPREGGGAGARAAPYFSNTVAWTPWLRSIAGLRADFQDLEVASSTPANSGKAHDHIVSPRLSLIFGPWSRTEYFVNYGHGFHSNDARGATI